MRVVAHKIFILPDAGSLKAFCDITLDDEICIKGLRVIEGKRELFVTMPREQGKDDKWYDMVTCLNSDIFDTIAKVVLDAYYENGGSVLSTKEDTWENLV